MNLIDSVACIKYKLTIWKGEKVPNDYDGKMLLNYHNKPLFAELVVLEMYKEEGYDGVWVDNYGKKFRIGLPEIIDPVELLGKQKKIFENIVEINGGRSGCWDLFLWKGNELKLLELKRIGRDKIRATQLKWLDSALKCGLKTSDFKIIEWDLN